MSQKLIAEEAKKLSAHKLKGATEAELAGLDLCGVWAKARPIVKAAIGILKLIKPDWIPTIKSLMKVLDGFCPA